MGLRDKKIKIEESPDGRKRKCKKDKKEKNRLKWKRKKKIELSKLHGRIARANKAFHYFTSSARARKTASMPHSIISAFL